MNPIENLNYIVDSTSNNNTEFYSYNRRPEHIRQNTIQEYHGIVGKTKESLIGNLNNNQLLEYSINAINNNSSTNIESLLRHSYTDSLIYILEGLSTATNTKNQITNDTIELFHNLVIKLDNKILIGNYLQALEKTKEKLKQKNGEKFTEIIYGRLNINNLYSLNRNNHRQTINISHLGEKIITAIKTTPKKQTKAQKINSIETSHITQNKKTNIPQTNETQIKTNTKVETEKKGNKIPIEIVKELVNIFEKDGKKIGESIEYEFNLFIIENQEIINNDDLIDSFINKYPILGKIPDNLLRKRLKEVIEINELKAINSNPEENLGAYIQKEKGEITEEEFNKIIQKDLIKIVNIQIKTKKQKTVEKQKLKTKKNNKILGQIEEKNDYQLDTRGDKAVLLSKTGEKIEITSEEAKIVKNNPEAINNLVNFHNFFKKLNLESIWDYRKELATTIGSINIDFGDANSVSKSELISFGNKLIKAINSLIDDNKQLKDKQKLKEVDSLGALKNEFRKFSKAGSMLSDNTTNNIEGEDKFASTLRQFGIIGGAYFNIHLLRKKMK